MPGDWISVSTTPTRRPSPARSAARLAVVFDFPVPPRYEWIEMICLRVIFSSVGNLGNPTRRKPTGQASSPSEILKIMVAGREGVALHHVRDQWRGTHGAN